MNKIALSAAALAIMAVGAQADLTIAFPAGSYSDSSAVNAAIPMQTFSDDLTSTELSMTNKVAKLSVTWGAVPAWGANAGILLPFNNLWAPIDMSKATAVSFKYKTSDAKTTVQFAPNSDLYPGILDGVVLTAALGASVAGTTKTVALPSGIVYLKWMIDDHAENTNLTWDDVKGEVKLLQFQPMPVYNSTGDAVTVPTAWMELSEVVVKGDVDAGGGTVNWLSTLGTGCTGSKVFQLDKFAEGSNQNAQGGYWYTFTDADAPGKAGGVSTIKNDASTNEQGIEFILNDGTMAADLAGITATLDKGDASAKPYGGWADFGTGYQDANGSDVFLDHTGLKAISFYIQFGENFDTENLTGVDFKVQNDPAEVGDSVQFNAGIKPELANGKEVCIDLNQFKQPAWFKQPLSSMPLSIGKFSWEVKINKDATVAAAPSTFYIGNVKIWGVEPSKILVGISSQKVGGKSALVANYSKGLVLSYDLAGASAAKIDVVRMDGSKVASFEGASKVSNQSFSVNLARGTYLAVVKGGKTNLVAPFAVAK